VAEPVSLLMIQFLDWVASRPRTYAEAMDAWRTSCPRLSVWEDALIAGLVEVNGGLPRQPGEVALTPRGRATLEGNRGSVPTSPAVAAEPKKRSDLLILVGMVLATWRKTVFGVV
jgi:hypothetical protein